MIYQARLMTIDRPVRIVLIVKTYLHVTMVVPFGRGIRITIPSWTRAIYSKSMGSFQ